MTFIYIDISNAYFNEIERKIEQWLETHPKPSGVTRRLWIKNVTISPWTYSDFQEISANASGVVGDTVGAKGSVYNKQQTIIKEPIVGMEIYDMDAMTIAFKAKKPIQDVLEASRYSTIISDRLY